MYSQFYISSLSLLAQNISNIKQKPGSERYYNIGSWCDALDYTGVWRLGRITVVEGNYYSTFYLMKITGDYVLVAFDGWSERWNQVNNLLIIELMNV